MFATLLFQAILLSTGSAMTLTPTGATLFSGMDVVYAPQCGLPVGMGFYDDGHAVIGCRDNQGMANLPSWQNPTTLTTLTVDPSISSGQVQFLNIHGTIYKSSSTDLEHESGAFLQPIDPADLTHNLPPVDGMWDGLGLWVNPRNTNQYVSSGGYVVDTTALSSGGSVTSYTHQCTGDGTTTDGVTIYTANLGGTLTSCDYATGNFLREWVIDVCGPDGMVLGDCPGLSQGGLLFISCHEGVFGFVKVSDLNACQPAGSAPCEITSDLFTVVSTGNNYGDLATLNQEDGSLWVAHRDGLIARYAPLPGVCALAATDTISIEPFGSGLQCGAATSFGVDVADGSGQPVGNVVITCTILENGHTSTALTGLQGAGRAVCVFDKPATALAGTYTLQATAAALSLTTSMTFASDLTALSCTMASGAVVQLNEGYTPATKVDVAGSTGNLPFGQTVEISSDDATPQICDATLVSGSSTATCASSFQWATPGVKTLTAAYTTDNCYKSFQCQVSVNVVGPSVIAAPSVEVLCGIGPNVVIRATLRDATAGQALSGYNLHFQGIPGCAANPTGTNGVATCSFNQLTPGVYPLTIVFNGQGSYLPSNVDTSYTVDPVPLSLSAAPTKETFVLTNFVPSVVVSGGPFLAGNTLTFTVDDQTCTGPLAVGTVSCSSPIRLSRAGSFAVSVAYAGDSCTAAASASFDDAVIATQQTSVTYNSPPTAVCSQSVTLDATVFAEPQHSGLDDQYTTFTSAGATCSQYSDSVGDARCAVTFHSAGPQTITVSVPDNSAAFIQGSSTSAQINVAKQPTSIVYGGQTVIAAGLPFTFTATLFTSSGPLSNQAVSFTLGSNTCSASTGSNGVASCTVSSLSATLGTGSSVTASFAGDSCSLASSVSADVLVYAFPAGGDFVVGDISSSVGSHVTFWGAQWAKNNVLSVSGQGPNSMKGWVNAPFYPGSSATPQCGGTWSARTGNSGGAPSSVPAYVGVIRASQAGQSGSTISGSIVGIAVVKVDPGYSGSPGFAGTGPVVASVSC